MRTLSRIDHGLNALAQNADRTTMSTTKFVVSHMDEQMGPFDEQQLKAAWVKGEILPIDYVYDEAKQDWVLLAERFPWAAKAQNEDLMPPPPTFVRNATVVSRRLNQDLAMRNAQTAPTIDLDALERAEAASESTFVQKMPAVTSTANAAKTTETAAKSSDTTAPMAVTAAPAPRPTPVPIATTPLVPASLLAATAAPVSPAIATTAAVATVSTSAIAPMTTPAATPSPAQIKIKSEPLKLDPSAIDAKVTLVDGVGEIDLSALNPGHVELILQDTSKLTQQEPLHIHVKPAEPVSVTWSLAPFLVVGQELEIAIKALDEKGQVCLSYSDQFNLKVEGDHPQDLVMKTTDGQASVKLTNERAEKWSLSLHYSGPRKLRLPETHMLEWQAGPAARLVIDGNQEYVAGQPIKVQVKAVDVFGNVAKHFKGTVVLEVKAS